LAVAIATCAVTLLILWVGSVPWISLILAVSFGFYGLLRKTVAVNPSVGLTVETAILLPFTPLMMTRHALDGTPLPLSTYMTLLLIGTLTAMPLVWFSAAAKRLRLATMGFLQYITPTLQFLLATLAFHEPFARPQVVAFVLIWTALIIYAYDSAARLPDRRRL
jgi:chloramphenicol-sensitive protein RarD